MYLKFEYYINFFYINMQLKLDVMNKLDIFNEWASSQKLEVRSNPVGINWYTINNSQLIKMGVKENECENWKDMFSIDDMGTFKESYYISDLMRIFFGNMNLGSTGGIDTFYGVNKDNMRKVKYLFRLREKTDKDADWIIFTTVGNNIHTKLKEIIESLTVEYNVEIMDGGDKDRFGTSNKECEKTMKEYSEEARIKDKKMIFISSLMGTRSWSNKYVKNVLLLFDSGSFDTNTQRIARGWTPWKGHNMCNIFDFRLSYEYPSLGEKYLINSFITKERYSGDTINEIIGKINSSDKIAFIDVYVNINDPFKELTIDEMKEMILANRDFMDYRIEKNFNLDNISSPDKEVTKLFVTNQGLKSTNIKGDKEKELKKKIKNTANKYKKNNDKEYENNEIIQKIKYIEFIKNNGQLFNPKNFTGENVLTNIYNDIDTHKDYIENKLEMTFKTVKDILYQFTQCQILEEFNNLFIWK